MARFRETFKNENLENIFSHLFPSAYLLDKNFFRKFWILMFYIEKWVKDVLILLFCIEKRYLHSYVLYWKVRKEILILLFCIEKKYFEKCHFKQNLHSYVLSWKVRKEILILLFCIEKRYFEKKIENFEFLCFILKSEKRDFNSLVLYWKQIFDLGKLLKIRI